MKTLLLYRGKKIHKQTVLPWSVKIKSRVYLTVHLSVWVCVFVCRLYKFRADGARSPHRDWTCSCTFWGQNWKHREECIQTQTHEGFWNLLAEVVGGGGHGRLEYSSECECPLRLVCFWPVIQSSFFHSRLLSLFSHPHHLTPIHPGMKLLSAAYFYISLRVHLPVQNRDKYSGSWMDLQNEQKYEQEWEVSSWKPAMQICPIDDISKPEYLPTSACDWINLVWSL